MNDHDLKTFDIKVIGKGSEYFESIEKEESDTFEKKGLNIGITEAFSAPEVTQVLISIGSNVIAGLSVYYISKIFDKIFTAKEKAKQEGQELEISVMISEKVSIRNIESIKEVEKALEIVITKNSK